MVLDVLRRMLVQLNDEGTGIQSKQRQCGTKTCLSYTTLENAYASLVGNQGQLCVGSSTPQGCHKSCTINPLLANKKKTSTCERSFMTVQ